MAEKKGRLVAAIEVPPLADMTDAEVTDIAGVIADTIADALRAEPKEEPEISEAENRALYGDR